MSRTPSFVHSSAKLKISFHRKKKKICYFNFTKTTYLLLAPYLGKSISTGVRPFGTIFLGDKPVCFVLP